MSVSIQTNAITDSFVVDYNEVEVIVRLHPDCTGWISVYVVDDTVETLEMTLQHDSDTCPVHEES